MAGGIQTVVNGLPAPGIAGDFASDNPRSRVLAGPGGLVSGGAVYGTGYGTVAPATGGSAIVGRFGWLSPQAIDPDNAATIVNSFYSPGGGTVAAITGINGAGAPDGFISRPDSPAVITVYLADATLVIQEGAPVPLWADGDWWILNSGTTQALVGQKAYANLANGLATFAATGSAGTVAFTGGIAAESWSATGSITGNVMTVGIVTGTLAVGATVTGSGVASGTTVVAQLSGTAGATGTYALNNAEQTIASGTALSGTYGLMTVSAGPSSGSIVVGSTVTGSGVTTGTIITQLGTGAGGTGTYYVNLTQTVSGGTSLTGTTTVETKWYCRSQGNAGEIVKISSVNQ